MWVTRNVNQINVIRVKTSGTNWTGYHRHRLGPLGQHIFIATFTLAIIRHLILLYYLIYAIPLSPLAHSGFSPTCHASDAAATPLPLPPDWWWCRHYAAATPFIVYAFTLRLRRHSAICRARWCHHIERCRHEMLMMAKPLRRHYAMPLAPPCHHFVDYWCCHYAPLYCLFTAMPRRHATIILVGYAAAAITPSFRRYVYAHAAAVIYYVSWRH